MKRINFGRIIAGGIASSIVLFIVGGVVNGAILGASWNAWVQAQGPLNHAPAMGVGLALWGVVSLINGITGVWIYAGIRPRYGAGPKTAVIAGLLLWSAGWLAHAVGNYNLGSYPHDAIVGELLSGLIGTPLAILAGAWIYKE